MGKHSYVTATDLFCGAGGSSLGVESAGGEVAMAGWDALFAAHGKQLGEYEVAEAERVIGCQCGARFSPEESEPCRVCGSPLCPSCDRLGLLAGALAVCRGCRGGQLHCDRCSATVGIVGPAIPEGWATSATITLCPRCLGDCGVGA